MNIDVKCRCDCGCDSMVTVPKCQSRGKIWCSACWEEHATEEDRKPVPWWPEMKKLPPPRLIEEPIVPVKPMPKRVGGFFP